MDGGGNPHEKIRSSRIIPLKYSAIFPFSSEKRGNHVTWARAPNFWVFVMRVLDHQHQHRSPKIDLSVFWKRCFSPLCNNSTLLAFVTPI